MKNSIRIIFLACGLYSFNYSTAQQGEWCGSITTIQQRIANDVQLARQWEDFKIEFKQQSQNASDFSSRAATPPVYIPIVFHIVHNGDALGTGENITDAQAISQIDVLNSDYNFQDPDMVNVPAVFQNLIANCNIKFCLAKFDENGNPTTGVIRHQFPNATWDSENDIDNTLKPATIWDPSRYLNIWTVNMGGQLITDGILAYSSLPGFGSADADGVVTRSTNIGTTGSVLPAYRKGKTVTHEIGHWLGLIHIWGFDSGCGDFGDFIDDTPDQGDKNFGCPSFPSISCNNGPNGDMFMNYMDYTDEGCESMFTIDQAIRMHSTLDGTRATIKSASSECFFDLDAAVAKIVLPNDTICSLTFKPVVTIRNAGKTTITSGKFYSQIDGSGVQIFDWSGSILMQEEAMITLPVQSVTAGVHSYDVTFGNVNGQPSDGFSGNDNQNLSFFAYDGGSSATPLFTEDFENGYPPVNWSNNNPNGDVTWVLNTTCGGYGLSSNCVSINNKGYLINPNGRKDAILTEVYDFTNILYPELRFDIAYARINPDRSDSLNVYYSLDCGSNWIKVWNQRGYELKTDTDQVPVFKPTDSEWKTISVPLTSIGLHNKVSLKFENVAGWGNTMYLDNINIRNNPGLTVSEIKKFDVKIFPNPAGKLVAVRLPSNHPFSKLQLMNSLGELVYETGITDDAIIFSLENFMSGLYLVHLEGINVTQTEKLLISK